MSKGWLLDRGMVEFRLEKLKLEFCKFGIIILPNNTPPASRQISAPRGVTRFWGKVN